MRDGLAVLAGVSVGCVLLLHIVAAKLHYLSLAFVVV